ncbi:MAG TPA: class I SAM-dependent methyltransferase [Candidatus Nanoarchaeia archaeon]|nr:class I SAM-dependent methyltransferase [Candidatus Nanoarchaeia archaeon]
MDARKLGFQSNVFDEVHMHYLVTQPEITQKDIVDMVQEAYRVLRPNGWLIATGEKRKSLLGRGSSEIEAREAIESARFSTADEQMLPYVSAITPLVQALRACR